MQRKATSELATAVIIIEIIKSREGGNRYTFIHRHFNNCLYYSVALLRVTPHTIRFISRKCHELFAWKFHEEDNDRISSAESLRRISFCHRALKGPRSMESQPTSDLPALILFLCDFQFPNHTLASDKIEGSSNYLFSEERLLPRRKPNKNFIVLRTTVEQQSRLGRKRNNFPISKRKEFFTLHYLRFARQQPEHIERRVSRFSMEVGKVEGKLWSEIFRKGKSFFLWKSQMKN